MLYSPKPLELANCFQRDFKKLLCDGAVFLNNGRKLKVATARITVIKQGMNIRSH